MPSSEKVETKTAVVQTAGVPKPRPTALVGPRSSTLRARRLSLGPILAWLTSMCLLFMIISPILIVLWGSITTLKAFGAAAETGAGWAVATEEVNVSEKERLAHLSVQEGKRETGVVSQQELGIFGASFRRTTGWFTLNWFRYVFTVYGQTMIFSLQLAFISFVVTLLIGVPGGYALVKYNFPGRNLLEELVLMPLSLPGIAVAVAVIATYGLIRQKWYFVLIGHLLYTMPYMVQAVTNTLKSFDFFELEQAAASLGARPLQRFRYIILGNLTHAIILGGLMVIAISLGEFNASFLLNTPVNQTFPAALYDTYNNDSFQTSSAATVIFLAVLFPILITLQFAGGKEMKEMGQAA